MINFGLNQYTSAVHVHFKMAYVMDVNAWPGMGVFFL